MKFEEHNSAIAVMRNNKCKNNQNNSACDVKGEQRILGGEQVRKFC